MLQPTICSRSTLTTWAMLDSLTKRQHWRQFPRRTTRSAAVPELPPRILTVLSLLALPSRATPGTASIPETPYALVFHVSPAVSPLRHSPELTPVWAQTRCCSRSDVPSTTASSPLYDTTSTIHSPAPTLSTS